METKFQSLRHPLELGSRFDDWQVCWLGGWDKHRHFYLVMLVKVTFKKRRKQKTPPGKYLPRIRMYNLAISRNAAKSHRTVARIAAGSGR
jgi:hypothetical protein